MQCVLKYVLSPHRRARLIRCFIVHECFSRSQFSLFKTLLKTRFVPRWRVCGVGGYHWRCHVKLPAAIAQDDGCAVLTATVVAATSSMAAAFDQTSTTAPTKHPQDIPMMQSGLANDKKHYTQCQPNGKLYKVKLCERWLLQVNQCEGNVL